jgi:6-phosphogluconolactonase
MLERHFPVFLSVLMLVSGPWVASLPAQNELDVWIGTGGKPSKGIYHSTLDTRTGKLSESRLVAEMSGPGFLAMNPKATVLYAVGNLGGQPVVAAFDILGSGPQSQLKLNSSLEIGDGGAAHVGISQDGKTLVTAQYGSGSVASFSVDPSGKLLERTGIYKHQGGSRVVAGRQDSPHAHWAGFSPDQKFVLVPDLGLDEVVIYKVDPLTSKLTTHGSGRVPPGGGPRHMKFHPNGRWIYVLNELELSVSLFDWDAAAGKMTLRSTVPSVSAEEKAQEQFNSCSEIRIHPNGRFVYSANRGHDTITVFHVTEDGSLKQIQNEHVRGATPRNFNLDPSAKWLLTAGQDSHTLASFAVDSETGRITYNRSVITTPTPICVLMKPD